MKKILVTALSTAIAICPAAAFAKDKDPNAKTVRLAPAADGNTVVTLTNGAGDGRVTMGVDGYGSFGSSTPAGSTFYDPTGAGEPASVVYESAVYFSGIAGFLSTDDIGTGKRRPPIAIEQPDPATAISTFTVNSLSFKLTQTLLPATANGSTLVQKYEITNTRDTTAVVRLVRHVDGDLYFSGDLDDDFAGISSDGKTLYEFDTGDDPASPTTFFGITSDGGTDAGATIQPFRYSDDIQSANGLPAGAAGVIVGDDDGNRVTDAGYDVTLSQQRRMSIPAGETQVYTTSTIFGQGSISVVTASVGGCLQLDGNPLQNRPVIARQLEQDDLTTTTDTGGCFGFSNLVSGKTFSIIVKGPRIRTQ